ncbi:MAG TPA: hypothetical protein VKE41_13000 [Roseiflexaceae bacterium]|nr:hypothetical protein [Roseiflexaceae bacterium]
MAESAREHNDVAQALERLEQQLARGRARLAELQAQGQAALREVKLARAAASDLSWELADVEQRLRELNEQREGPGDPLLEREIASLTTSRAVLEERVLAQMLLVDDLAARAGEAEQALAMATQEWAAREAVLIAKRDRMAANIVEKLGSHREHRGR